MKQVGASADDTAKPRHLRPVYAGSISSELDEVDLSSTDSALIFDLSELERWLKHAERVLARLRAKPRKLVHFERALAEYEVTTCRALFTSVA